MNEQMRERHMEILVDAGAINLYDRLCAACEKREEGMSDAEQTLVGDIAQMEQVKAQLLKDVALRGVSKERRNGRQTYAQENKSVPQTRAYMEQMRKHLAELRLTPNSRRAKVVELEAGEEPVDEFEQF